MVVSYMVQDMYNETLIPFNGVDREINSIRFQCSVVRIVLCGVVCVSVSVLM